MCGITGWFDLRGRPGEAAVLARMAATLIHRGPDAEGYFLDGGAALGFRRLSIIDLETGDQPLYNEDGSLVLICNGEIFNYRELREELLAKGHSFRTRSDVEVLLHLYEEHGTELFGRLNGQYSLALYDRRAERLLLARDPLGINPMYYAETDGTVLFGSEIKAILAHPLAPREVDLTGLDQVLTFPGLVGSRTLFAGISCLEAGHYLSITSAGIEDREYWDLIYPTRDEAEPEKAEDEWVEELREKLQRAVAYRLRSDVPVGFYLSGGVDSSLIGALMARTSGEPLSSFSITFPDQGISEAGYQRLMAGRLGSVHHEIHFDWQQIADRLPAMIHHCECPLKETFDTCAMALSEKAKRTGITVVLAGQGADELFAGYVGYRFDQARTRQSALSDIEAVLEAEIRERLWGDPDLFYEVDFMPLRDVKSALYSADLAARLAEFDCTNHPVVNAQRLRGRHPLHQRSYLDVKLRLTEHLLSEHGDRMILANSVEGRYPFLDPEVVALATRLPPSLKVRDLVEKYIVKQVASGLVPQAIREREKFGFRAPGTPYLLQQKVGWIEDLLSYDRIRSQGYFNPDVVERLKERYRQPGFTLNPHLETDLLMIVLTFGLLVDAFKLPRLQARVLV